MTLTEFQDLIHDALVSGLDRNAIQVPVRSIKRREDVVRWLNDKQKLGLVIGITPPTIAFPSQYGVGHCNVTCMVEVWGNESVNLNELGKEKVSPEDLTLTCCGLLHDQNLSDVYHSMCGQVEQDIEALMSAQVVFDIPVSSFVTYQQKAI